MRTHIVPLLVIALLMVGSTGIARAQDDPTILWYKFDVPFKGQVEDLSGNGNHGQVAGAVELEPDGKVGSAARFTLGAKSQFLSQTASILRRT